MTGHYLLLNLETNMFLSANALNTAEEPLLLTPTPVDWSISSIPGTNSKRLSAAAAVPYFVVAPPADSIWASTADPGETFAIATNGKLVPQDDSDRLKFTRDDTTGWYTITSVALKTVLGVSKSTDANYTHVVAWAFPAPGLTQSWRLIRATASPRTWSIPTWQVPPTTAQTIAAQAKVGQKTARQTTSATIANLADGVYRITNQHTKGYLVLSSTPGSNRRTPREVQISKDLKDVCLSSRPLCC